MPKEEGGLGLSKVKEFNDACLLKLGWTAATSDSIWATWFRGDILETLLSGSLEIPRQSLAPRKDSILGLSPSARQSMGFGEWPFYPTLAR